MKSLNQFINEVEGSEVNGFCVLKPEFLSHTEDFLKMLANQGWTVIQKIKKTIDLETAKKLYQMHKDKDFYNDLCNYMSSGDALYCLCQKPCDNPCKDMKDLKDKVRKAWGKDDMRNAMHSSDTLANVNRESKLIFENKIVESCCCSHPHIDNGCCDTCCSGECCGVPLPTKSIYELQMLGLNMTPEQYMQYTDLLRTALAEEFLAWYQYYIVIPFLNDKPETKELAKLFAEIADDELHDHAAWIMQKMKAIDYEPSSLYNAYWHNYICCKHRSDIYTSDTLENIVNNITLETGAIDTYVHLAAFTKDLDPDGYVKIKDIITDEQEHLQKLQKLMNKYYTK